MDEISEKSQPMQHYVHEQTRNSLQSKHVTQLRAMNGRVACSAACTFCSAHSHKYHHVLYEALPTAPELPRHWQIQLLIVCDCFQIHRSWQAKPPQIALFFWLAKHLENTMCSKHKYSAERLYGLYESTDCTVICVASLPDYHSALAHLYEGGTV